MGVKKTTLSGWQLSGQAAEAFARQVKDNTPNPLAKDAARRGEKLYREYVKNGFVTIPPINNKNYL